MQAVSDTTSIVARWSPTAQGRYHTAVREFRALAHLWREPVLDFGSSGGLSLLALHAVGVSDCWGVEPERARVEGGLPNLRDAGIAAERLQHVPDTRVLPFPAAYFGTVLANAVLEHIPQPREAYIRELWRVLAPGGHLIVAETPNKYLPLDYHTTNLWGVPWLPTAWARRYAIWRGRYSPTRDWEHSGWRGIGYWELVAPLTDYELIPEHSVPRHRLLTALGIPASIFDPYPCWVLRKV